MDAGLFVNHGVAALTRRAEDGAEAAASASAGVEMDLVAPSKLTRIGDRVGLILGLILPFILTIVVARIRSRRRNTDGPAVSNIEGAI